MKIKYFSVLLIVSFFLLFSCRQKPKENNQVLVEQIDTKFFVDNVAKIDNETLTYIGDKPTIVDFYASWCGPCKMLSPIMEKLSKKYEDKVNFYKIDVDESSDLANTLKIKGIPTLIFFKDSLSTSIIIEGFMTETELEHYISSYLLK
ncbi:MAG: thioredoxin [Bacteroidales bacterium]|nr:thioredoxin [Bacteroidales bacterium]